MWVRETWATEKRFDSLRPKDIPINARIWYLADGVKPEWAGKIRPSIFMMRWMSRIDLDNENVEVERVQEITEEDAEKEGMDTHIPEDKLTWKTPREQFVDLWDSIYGKDAWTRNDFVWAIEFRRI